MGPLRPSRLPALRRLSRLTEEHFPLSPVNANPMTPEASVPTLLSFMRSGDFSVTGNSDKSKKAMQTSFQEPQGAGRRRPSRCISVDSRAASMDGDGSESCRTPATCSRPTSTRTRTERFGSSSLTLDSLSPGSSELFIEPKTPINRAALFRGWREGSARQYFTWQERDALGQGSFGKVFRGRCNYQSNRAVAVKQVSRAVVDDLDQLWAEIQIMSELDHPNILRFLEAYNDWKNIYVVTEVCLGGSLHDWLPVVAGDLFFAERFAREVGGALAYCHSRGVCHRDLKLENILLVRDSIDSPMRIADFGLAKRCSQRIRTQRLRWHEARSASKLESDAMVTALSSMGSVSSDAMQSQSARRSADELAMVRLTSFKGTPAYMAPEVIRILDCQVKSTPRHESFYDFRCDVWSLGVMVHVLLTGVPPYSMEDVSAYVAEGSELGIMPLIDEIQQMEAIVTEEDLQWSNAGSFVALCMQPDFHLRPTASDLLSHRWLRKASTAVICTGFVREVVTSLERFCRLTRFKQAALLAAVRHMNTLEHEQLRDHFQVLDAVNVGHISIKKVCSLFKDFLPDITGEDEDEAMEYLEDILDGVDSNSKGHIDFNEFLAAMIDPALEDRVDLARAAFRSFDYDADGMLGKTDLAFVFDSPGVADILLRTGDEDKDGELSFDEFLLLLRKG